jgi:uncharacterized protein (DUF305 family)
MNSVLVVTLCMLAASPLQAQNPPTVQPGAPGQPSTTLAGKQPPMVAMKATAADITFMQGMIAHHAQAIDMTTLLYERTQREDMKMLARRIDVSQNDEMKMMRRWLAARGAEVPGEHAHHMMGDDHLMPGMLTAKEMKALGEAKGPAFDTLFLEGMIKHHGGALIMVADLFKTPGAAQESDIFDFASHVDADQRMEIIRMSSMLKGSK